MTFLRINTKVLYVKSQEQTRRHECHWPSCNEQVAPAKWGCAKHWYMLPLPIRTEIWKTFQPGQEQTGTPSHEYIAAARAAQNWIKVHLATLPEQKGLF